MDIINYLSASLAPLLGIVTAVILILQYYLQRLRWRLELYDKRYPVYRSTIEFIGFIVQRADVANEELNKFLRNSKDNEFLFGKEIQKYLDEIYSNASNFETNKRILEGKPEEETRLKLIEDDSKLLKWFMEQFEICKKNFGEYLTIDKK